MYDAELKVFLHTHSTHTHTCNYRHHTCKSRYAWAHALNTREMKRRHTHGNTDVRRTHTQGDALCLAGWMYY